MTDDIRGQIVQSIEKTESKRIIITHGTSTLTNTAEFLSERLGASDKTAVLTGAMIPLKEFAMSDGGFNLGHAVCAAQTLESGVYICMNAQTFKAGEAVKDVQQARFLNKS